MILSFAILTLTQEYGPVEVTAEHPRLLYAPG
jgi:hypothetical protein